MLIDNIYVTKIKNNTMKRKFTHYAINTLLISLASTFIFGFVNLVYHLLFNDYTITFGGF